MKKFTKRKRMMVSLLIAMLFILQETAPALAHGAEALRSMPRYVDFSRPQAIKSLSEVIDVEEDEPPEPITEENVMTEASGAAGGEDPAGQEETPAPIDASREPEEYYPIPEVPGRLVDYDETSRTYHVGDGKYVTEFGGYTGTYIDEAGEAQLIDNTLEKVPEQSDEPYYENASNAYQVRIPEILSGNTGIKVIKDGHVLELSPLDGDLTRPNVKDNAILYNDVFENIDYQYTVVGNSIKEDIILRERTERASFSMAIDAGGLKIKEKEGVILIYEDDETDPVFCLTAPQMYDAAGETSLNVMLSLMESDGVYTVTVTPDAAWLAAKERAYPVRIDPSTVSIDASQIGLYGVEEGSPNLIIGDNRYPYVGYDDGIASGNWIFNTQHMMTRTYIDVNYDFTSLGANARIDSASFNIHQSTNFSNQATKFGLYVMDDAWNPNTITWNSQLTANHTFIESRQSPGPNGLMSFDITELVNNWVQGIQPQNGMVLKAIDERNMQCEVFYNKTHATLGPSITVEWTYVDPDDPFLKALPLDGLSIEVRAMTEKAISGKLQFDAVFADGLATAGSKVEYFLEGEGTRITTDAAGQYLYPDSTAFNAVFPNGTKYKSLDSNWQSGLFTNLKHNIIYQFKGKASKDGATGKEAGSDTFLVYKVTQFDTFPKIASYYGVTMDSIMKDNRAQDTLVIENNTIFIRNPKTAVAYNPPALTDADKRAIDGALMGRGIHCEFGFEPINLNTGNFYMSATDAQIEDLGGSFDITRSYNSKGAAYHSVFGRGWDASFAMSLSSLENGRVVLMRGDGSFLYLKDNGSGAYEAPEGYNYTLKAVDYSKTDKDYIGWEMTDSEKKVYSFDKYGMLRLITDTKGYVTTLSYDAMYRLKKLTSPSGKAYDFTFNDQGLIIAIGLPNGAKLGYEYDASGNLVKYTNANGDSRRYVYNGSHQMTQWHDEDGVCAISNTYDSEGRVTQQQDANGGIATFKYTNGQTVTADNLGNETTYQYDSQYRTTKIIHPDGTEVTKSYHADNQLKAQTDEAGNTTSYTYDSEGNVLTIMRADGAVRTMAYNQMNLVTKVIDYDQSVSTMDYDAYGNLTRTTCADGSQIQYRYDSLHRLKEVTDANGNSSFYTYDGAMPISFQDGEGHIYTFAYNAMNQLTKMTDPEGNAMLTAYDRVGNVISETAGDGGTVVYSLNKAGNPVAVTDERGKTSTVTYDKIGNVLSGGQPNGNIITFTYDANYNLLSEADGLGYATTYTYDSRNRQTSMTSPDGGVTTYTYDALGNVLSTTDPLGNTDTIEYDAVLGLATKMTDANGGETIYGYDALGRLISAAYPDGGTEAFAYDRVGNLTASIDVLGAETIMAYDGAGNLIRMTDAQGNASTYDYDKNNQMIQVTTPAGTSERIAYDGAGRAIQTVDLAGRTWGYEYDGAGRLVQMTDPLGGTYGLAYDMAGNLLSTTDENGNTTAYTYDGIGRMTSMTDPLGNISALNYDAVGNMVKSIDALGDATEYGYSWSGQEMKVLDALGNAYAYEYDLNGNNTKIILPTGDETALSYDALGNLIEALDAAGLKTTLAYDSMGRIIKAEDTAGNSVGYAYDTAGNLLSETDSLGRSIHYEYDSLGRLIKQTGKDGAATEYEYDALARVTKVKEADGNATDYAYDEAGNVIKVSGVGGAIHQYVYDALDRMTQATDPVGAVTGFSYDPAGNLAAQAGPGGATTSYSYDGNNNVTASTDGNGGVTAYAYDELLRIIGVTDPMGNTEEYRYDALSNLTKYKDGNGMITEYTYDALGNMTEVISPLGGRTSYIYNIYGEATSITDPLGVTTAYEVDANGRLTKLTQANGGEYHYAYDTEGRMTGIKTPLGYEKALTYDAGDRVVGETDSLGRATTYAYDVMGRLTAAKDPLGGTATFKYDKRGNLVKETDPLGRTATYAYDLADQMTASTNPEGETTRWTYDLAGALTEIVEPGGSTTRYGYDDNENLVSVTDPMGNVTTATYDPNNRMASLTDALGQQESYTYDAAGQVTAFKDKAGHLTEYAYDPLGNITTLMDQEGFKTHYQYDLNSRLTKVTDALGGETKYAYDAMGNMTAYTDAMGRTTTYTYDLDGNRTSVKDGSGRVWMAGYDELGRTASYKMPGGSQTNYDYDALNNLVEKSYADADGNPLEGSVDYAYDAGGQRTSMSDATGTSRYKYDLLGRLVHSEDGFGKPVDYTYDEAGNIASMTYGDGTKVEYGYDLNGNLTHVTDGGGNCTRYSYDALGRLVKTERPNGTQTIFTYDVDDQVTEVANSCVACGADISIYTYTYNAAGNITKETAKEAQEGYTCGAKPTYTITERAYVYDECQQLLGCTQEERGAGKTVHTYSYDESGNRTSYTKKEDGRTTGKVTYEYNNANQLVSATDSSSGQAEVTRYHYDDDGNLIQTTGAEERIYEYTAENRLQAVYGGDELLLAAAYDGDGERVFQIDHKSVVVQTKAPDTTIWQEGGLKHGGTGNGEWAGGTWKAYDDTHPAGAEAETDTAAGTGQGSEASEASLDAAGEDTEGEDAHIFWYGFGQGIVQFFGGINQALSVDLSRWLDGAWESLFGDGADDGAHADGMAQAPKDGENEAAGGAKAQGDENTESIPWAEHNRSVLDAQSSGAYQEKGSWRAADIPVLVPGKTGYEDQTDYELTYYLNDINTEHAQVLAAYGQSGEVKSTYVYGNGRASVTEAGDNAASVNSILPEGAQMGYYIYDGRGSVSQVVSEAGDYVAGYGYDPFGNMTKGMPEAGNVFGYNAEAYNAAADIQYLRARYYDAGTGRFVSEDDYLGDKAEPLSRNRYIYGQNNPVGNVDPSGHAAIGAGRQVANATAKILARAAANTKAKAVVKATAKAAEKLKKTYQKFSKSYDVLQPFVNRNKAMSNMLARSTNSVLNKMASKSKSAAYSDYLKALSEAARKKRCEEEAARLAAEQKKENFLQISARIIIEDLVELKDGLAGILSGAANTAAFWQSREQKDQTSNAIKQLFGVENDSAFYTGEFIGQIGVTVASFYFTGGASAGLQFAGYAVKAVEGIQIIVPMIHGASAMNQSTLGNMIKEASGSSDKGASEADGKSGDGISEKDVDVNNLPEGWTKTENNGYTHIKDENGKTRIRLDPPDNKTPYDHKHLYDENGNPLDANGNIVNKKSPDAHIPYNK